MDRVSTGEKVRGTSRANSFNTLQEMQAAFKDQRARAAAGLSVDSSGIAPTLTVLAFRKTTDDDLDIFSPVKLRQVDVTDPGPQTPADFDVAYASTPLIYALSPSGGDESEAVGICQAAIPAGRFGPVAVSGVTMCTINITDTGHLFATLTGDETKLLSADSGPVRILWKPSASTGDRQCVVMLNAGSGGGSGDDSFWVEITGNAGGAEPSTTYSWKKKILDPVTHLFIDADPAVTGTNTLKRAKSNVPSPEADVIPLIPNGQMVRVWPSPTDSGKFECPAVGGLITIEFHRYRYDFETCEETDTTIRITGRDLTIAEI